MSAADSGVMGGSPNASSNNDGNKSDQKDKDPLTSFLCSICSFSLSDQCKFGRLEFDKVSYVHPVYYMRDPFEPPDVHKHPASFTVDDFLVLGANCHICEQPVCVDEECSLHYGNWYCVRCAMRERHSFPKELVQSLEKKLASLIEKKDAPEAR